VNDRRIWFFLVAAVASGALTPLAPDQIRWVPVATSVAYAVLTILVALDMASRRGHPGHGGGPTPEE